MFSFITTLIPSWNKLFIVVGIVSVVFFGYFYVVNMQKKIEKYSREKQILELQLKTQEQQNIQLKKDIDMIKKHYESVKKIDDNLIESYNNINIKLEKYGKNDRLKKILKSERAELMLKNINKQTECEINNFYNFNVVCVNGKVK